MPHQLAPVGLVYKLEALDKDASATCSSSEDNVDSFTCPCGFINYQVKQLTPKMGEPPFMISENKLLVVADPDELIEGREFSLQIIPSSESRIVKSFFGPQTFY